jgi:hypothetical protein
MINFKNYIGKKIKIGNETVKIKKLIEVEDNIREVGNPSFWSFQATYETENGRKVRLIYTPYGYLTIGRNGQIYKKEWEFLEEI